jgi:hypothetical protein
MNLARVQAGRIHKPFVANGLEKPQIPCGFAPVAARL